MRTILSVAAILTALIMPSVAHAVILDQVSGSADCNGWQADVTIWFLEGSNQALLTYAVVLTDAAGAEVQRFDVTEEVPMLPGQLVTTSYTGAWNSTPGDGWQVQADFSLLDVYDGGSNATTGAFITTVDCPGSDGGTAPPPVCVQPPGWWRRHRGEWPTDHMILGDQALDGDQIMQILRRPAWGNPALLLARHVVAAKFNVLIDHSADMEDALNAADDFLAEHPPVPTRGGKRDGWRRTRMDRREVRRLAMPILWYNWSGCRGEDPQAATGPVAVDLDLMDKAFTEAESPGESVSFGTLKSLYR